MGNEQNRGSSDARDNPEAPRVETEAEPEEQSAEKPSSDTGKETEAHSNEGNAAQTVPQQEEVNSITPPAEEAGPQENSPEAGQLPPPSQSASLDKPNESDTAKPPVAEPSSEKAEAAAPQIPPEAAGEPGAEPGVVPLTTEGPSTDPELQPTTKRLHCLAELIVQTKPCKISPCSPTKNNQCLGECSSFEFTVITEQLEVQSSVEAAEIAGENSGGAASALVAPGETQVGHSTPDAQTTEGQAQKGQITAEIPAETESPVTQQAQEVPLASKVVKHADTNSISGVQNDAAGSLGKEHPASATTHDPEAERLPDHLPKPSTGVLQDSDKAKEFCLVKKIDGTCSGSEAIEMAGVEAGELHEQPQTEHGSAVQETQPVAAAEVHTQPQGSSRAPKDSTEGAVHTRKHGPKFATPFYLCCSGCDDCSIGDGEQ